MTKKPSPKPPRKQRRWIYKAPIHAKRKFLRCRLDQFLQEEYGLRNLPVKKGDLVKVMRGQFRDTEGKVVRVDYSKIRVYIDSATTNKANATEVQIPIHPSNLMIVKLELDNERKQLIESKMVQIAESE